MVRRASGGGGGAVAATGGATTMDRKRAIDLGEPPAKNARAASTTSKPDEININGGINPWTHRAYTAQFYAILEKRKQLPVLKFKPVGRAPSRLAIRARCAQPPSSSSSSSSWLSSSWSSSWLSHQAPR